MAESAAGKATGSTGQGLASPGGSSDGSWGQLTLWVWSLPEVLPRAQDGHGFQCP